MVANVLVMKGAGALAAMKMTYCRLSDISRTLVGNKIVYYPDVVGAVPTGNVPTTSSFST